MQNILPETSTFNFACACLFVQPFWIPLLNNVERGIYEDLDEA